LLLVVYLRCDDCLGTAAEPFTIRSWILCRSDGAASPVVIRVSAVFHWTSVSDFTLRSRRPIAGRSRSRHCGISLQLVQ